MEQPRETAGITIRLIIEHVRRTYGEDAVSRMLERAGETRPLTVLEDERVWSSYEAKIKLFEAAAQVTGRPDIARRIGETVLASTVAGTLRVALGVLGSPAALVRAIQRANSKFATIAQMTAVQVRPTSAVVRYQVRPEFRLSQFDCDYTLGLLSQVPVLFGLPPASIQHTVCQVRGAEACLYQMRWRRYSRLPWRAGRDVVPADSVLVRLHQLQDTLADLVGADEVEDVLQAIAGRAPSAVNAERFVLAVRLQDDEPLRVRFDGVDPQAAATIAAQLVDGGPLDPAAGHALVVDVRAATRDYGRLAAFSRDPFLDAEHELLESYGRLAATALDSVVARAAVEERTRTAEALRVLAGELLRAHTRDEVAIVMAWAAQTVAQAAWAVVLLFDPGTGVLRVRGSAGVPDDRAELLGQVQVAPADVARLAARKTGDGAMVLRADQDADPLVAQLLGLLRVDAAAAVGIRGDQDLHGVVVAWKAGEPAPALAAPLQRLTGLADQAAVALEKVALVEQMHEQARTDDLTGLANRRALADELARVVTAADPHAPPALLFIDLDEFKAVNDTLGHSTGDQALAVVAQRLAGCVRSGDVVARLGGDEFTILLPSVPSVQTAVELADRVVAALAEPVWLVGHTLQLHASVGVHLIEPPCTVNDVLRDADAAMYAAKQAGGNQRVVFPADPS